MNDKCTPATERMLKVLKARWTVGEIAKKRSTMGVRIACALAACGVATAVVGPVDTAYADEGLDGANAPIAEAPESGAEAEALATAPEDGIVEEEAVSAADVPDGAASDAALDNAAPGDGADVDSDAALDDVDTDASDGIADDKNATADLTEGDEDAAEDAPGAEDPALPADDDSASTGDAAGNWDLRNEAANYASGGSANDNLFALGGETLKDLIDNAADGETIVLDGNMSYYLSSSSDAISIDKALVIDFNGHKLIVSGGYTLFDILENGALTLLDADMIVEDCLFGSLDGSVVIDGGKIVCNSYFVDDLNGSLAVNGSEIVCGDDFIDDANEGSKLVIEGAQLTITDSFLDDAYGTVDISDSTILCLEGTGIYLYEGGVVTLRNTDLITLNSSGINFGDGGTVYMYGGSIKSCDDCVNMSSGGQLVIYGGSFEADDDIDGCIYFGRGSSSGTVVIADGYQSDVADLKGSKPSAFTVTGKPFTINLHVDGELHQQIEGVWGDEIVMPADMGDNFLCWEDANGNQISSIDTYGKTINLYAIYSDSVFDVSFDDLGTVTTLPVSVYTKLSQVPGFDRVNVGDGFIGWMLDGVLVDATTDLLVRSDMILTAAYEGRAVVTFVDGDTSFGKSVLVGSSIKDLVELSRQDAGDNFYGWMLDGIRVDGDSPRVVRGDITLTAKYIENLVSVSNLDELVEAIAKKADFIELLKDIIVDETVQVDHSCTIFTKPGNQFGLIRPEGFYDALLEIVQNDEGEEAPVVTLDNVRVDGMGYEADDSAILVDEGTTLILNKSTVQNNNVTYRWNEGGGIHAEDATVILNESVVKNNHSESDGGGIYTETSNLHIIDSEIVDNVAEDDGGGIYWCIGYPPEDCEFTAINSVVNRNDARSGGGIYFEGRESVANLTDTDVSFNTASVDGGGLRPCSTIVYLNGKTTITHNKSDEGGGVYSSSGNDDDTQVVMKDDSQIAFNEAETNGGGACLDELRLVMYDRSSIHDNLAGEKGGGVCSSSYGLIQYGGSIYNNHAGKYGGGVYVWNWKTELDAGMIFDNTADECGDDLFVNSEFKLYANQPERIFGDGKSSELGTVTVKQIDGYHEATFEDGVSVPWYGWFIDGLPIYEQRTGIRYDGKTYTYNVLVGFSDRFGNIIDSKLLSDQFGVDHIDFDRDSDVYGGGLKAIWNGLLLAYDANFGDDPAYFFDTQAYLQGDNAVLRDCMFDRAGYVFLGWKLDPNGTAIDFAPGADLSMLDSQVLYAHWGCVVEYDVAGDPTYGVPEGFTEPEGGKYEVGTDIAGDPVFRPQEGTVILDDGREIGGIWVFVQDDGYTADDGWDVKAWGEDFTLEKNTAITGKWEFHPYTYKVDYVVNGDPTYGSPDGSTVPTDSNAYLPQDEVAVADGLIPAVNWAIVDGQKVYGTWVFSGWDTGNFLIEGDTVVTGGWTFVPDPVSAPDDDSEPADNGIGELEVQASAPAQASVETIQADQTPKTGDTTVPVTAACTAAAFAATVALASRRLQKRSGRKF